MEIQQISRADILDILFEGRNKDYGAYELRKTYNGRLTKALATTASVCLLLIGGYTLAGRSHPSKAATLMIEDSVTLLDPAHEPPVVPPMPRPQPQQIATMRSTIPIITKEEVRPEDVPPPNDDMDQVKIGTETHTGDPFDGTATPPSTNGIGQEVIEPPKKPDDDDKTIHMFVEIESTYPAGLDAWRRFLIKNFRVPEAAVSGTVIVQFIVDKEGNVSDVQAVSGPEELRAEAIRVIKKSGKWTPAIQNGRKVNSYKKQPIVVQLETE